MQLKFLLFITLCLLSNYHCFSQITGKVVGITDGDTFVILVKDSSFKVRLHGIDCPEKRQPYGMEAKKQLSDLIYLKEIRLETKGHDRYQRLIAISFLDTVCINTFMIELGYAWHYLKYDKNPLWTQIEEIAKLNRRGLWVDSLAIAPWEWRKK